MTDLKEMQIGVSENFWANISPVSTPSDLKSYETTRRMSEIWFVPIREDQSPSQGHSEHSESSDDVSFTSDLTPLSPPRPTMCFMNIQRSDATCECDFTCEGLTMNMLRLACSPDAFNESSSELERIFGDHASEHTDVAYEHSSVATPVSKREIHKSVFYADLSHEERSRLPKSNLYLYSVTHESSGPDKAATIHQYWELCQEDVELCSISVTTDQSLPLETPSFVHQNLDSLEVSVAPEDLQDKKSSGGKLIHPVCVKPKKKSVTFVDGNSIHLLRRDFHSMRTREQLKQEARRAKRHVKRKKKNAAEALRRHGDQLTSSQKITPRPGHRYVEENTASVDVKASDLDIGRSAMEKRMTTLGFYRSAGRLRSSSLESFKGSFVGSNKTENPPIKSTKYRSQTNYLNTPSRSTKNTSSNTDFSLKWSSKVAQCRENTAQGSPSSKKCFEKFSRQSEELGQSERSAVSDFGAMTPFERDSLDERLLEALLEQNAMRRGRVPRLAASSLWSSHNRKAKPGINNCGEGWGACRGKAPTSRFQGRSFGSKPSNVDHHHSRISVVKEIPKQKRSDYKSKANTLREPTSLKGRLKNEPTLSHKIRKPSKFKPMPSFKLMNFNRPKHPFWFDAPSHRNVSPRNEASRKNAKLLRKARSEPVLTHLARQRPPSPKKNNDRKSHVVLGRPNAEDVGSLCARSKQGINRTRSNSTTAEKKSQHKLNSTSRDLRCHPRKHQLENPQKSVSFANTKTCVGHKKRKTAPCSCVGLCPAWTRSQPKVGTPGKEKSNYSSRLFQWSVSNSPLSESPVRRRHCKERLHGIKGHCEKISTRHKKDSKSGSKKKIKNGLNQTKKKSLDLRRCRSSTKIVKSKIKSKIREALVYRSRCDLLNSRTFIDSADSPLAGTSRNCETPKEDSVKGNEAPSRVEVDASHPRKTPSPEPTVSRRGSEKNKDPKAEKSNIFSIIQGKLGMLVNDLGTNSG